MSGGNNLGAEKLPLTPQNSIKMHETKSNSLLTKKRSNLFKQTHQKTSEAISSSNLVVFRVSVQLQEKPLKHCFTLIKKKNHEKIIINLLKSGQIKTLRFGVLTPYEHANINIQLANISDYTGLTDA